MITIVQVNAKRMVKCNMLFCALLSRCDECHSAVAKTVHEARKLLEEGFEYVCQKADLMLFRKMK